MIYARACINELDTGVPASVVTTQASIESSYGKSIPIDKNSLIYLVLKPMVIHLMLFVEPGRLLMGKAFI